MKICELIDGSNIMLSNEEREFIKEYGDTVQISALYSHDQVIARNLVRKGVYEVSDDNDTLTLE